MELKIKLYVLDDTGEKYMGMGVLWLLEEMKTGCSLRSAALNLGISYSKAYHMISQLEKGLGVSVVERKKGGANREGAKLTPFAEKFINAYNAFQEETKAVTAQPFDRFKQAVASLVEAEK